jgi:hypothetical protein
MAAATSQPLEDSKHLEETGGDTHQAITGYLAGTGGNRWCALRVHTAEVTGSNPVAPTRGFLPIQYEWT